MRRASAASIPRWLPHATRSRGYRSCANRISPQCSVPTALRRIVVSEARAFSPALRLPRPIFEAQGSSVDPWGVARPMHAMGFRAGEIVLNTFSYHLVPAGFMMDSGRARTRMRRHSSGSRQHRTTVRIDRGLSAQPLLRHARLPQDPFQNGGRIPGATSVRSSARWFRRRLPEDTSGARSQRRIEAFQAYATADIGIIAYETPTRDGMVVNENLIVEIVRPGTGDPVDAARSARSL